MKMTLKPTLLILLCNIFIAFNTLAQHPLVYDIENTGADCEKPPLPDPEDLTSNPFLPDPFAWSDGSGRSTEFADWECRRNEIKAEVEHYELGLKPDRPADITASYADGTLTVEVTVNEETLTITSDFTIPDGEGPFPVIIGMNSGTGSLPAELFDGVIQVPFVHNQIVENNNEYNADDPYYRLYPELADDVIGHYSAWAWGFSRLLDGLELLQEELKIDMKHVAATGCSYAGKMALFSGAFDERVALTIAQESGGGGINSWRVSYDMVAVQGQEEVERISNTNYSWFKDDLRTNFDGAAVATMPYDHHEIMAMIAPRALLVLGNPPFVWLADESGYVSAKATEKVYDTFGIPERFGYSFRSGHDHCELPADSYPEVQAFVDRFLFGDTTADTDIHYQDDLDNIDYLKWIEGWEPPNPDAPLVSLDSPDNNSAYEAPANITFTASVTDINDNVTKIEFYNGSDKLGEATTSPYSFTWENIEAGTYYISAKAIDATDLEDLSNIVTIKVNNPSSDVYKANSAPTIDGVIDAIWGEENVESFEAVHVVNGEITDANDLSGNVKVLWDENSIYLLAVVTDDAQQNDSDNTYEDDNVEFYFDADNAKGSSYDANDGQYSFAWNDGTTVGTIPADKATTGTEYIILDTDNGYIAEIKIPWSVLSGTPVADMEIGFDFMINDDDDGDGRDGKLSWNATEDQAWQNASLFGTLKLSGTAIGSEKSDQTISITAIPDKRTSDAAFDVEASTTSELQLTYTVSGPASISENTISLDGTPGTVTVTVSQAGNDDFNSAQESVSFEVTQADDVTGFSNQEKSLISLYPNPTENLLLIDGVSGKFEYRITDISGKLLLSGRARNNISTEKLESGAYLLNIINGNKKTNIKFIKN